jgi:hypothetical protein
VRSNFARPFHGAWPAIEIAACTLATSKSGEVLQDQIHGELVYRPLQFHERSPDFIGAHDETLSVAMHVNNPDCSSFARRVGFAEGIFQLITLTVIVLTAAWLMLSLLSISPRLQAGLLMRSQLEVIYLLESQNTTQDRAELRHFFLPVKSY